MIANITQDKIKDKERLQTKAEWVYEGLFAEMVRFTELRQLKQRGLWKKFVEVFRRKPDAPHAWSGEYWGKTMRGAAWVYRYTRDPGLYEIMRETVCDLLGTVDAFGRISSYEKDSEFMGWDIWCRKYVLLGLQYFSEICEEEELNARILKTMCRHLDCIIAHVGDGEGKIPIGKTTNCWYGVNSCSILEPVLRLWRQTENPAYMEFAEYIIRVCGGEGENNIFEMAYADRLEIHQYHVVKAYEIMSCFEGLIEYYRITGEEKWKQAAINFGRRVREEELTVIGCCGCKHELFNHSAFMQTDTEYRDIMQETCVTVTWMKFALQMLRLTGDAAYADCIEQAFYNAYLGAFNTHSICSLWESKTHQPKNLPIPSMLPFDSYSPLVAGLRGQKVGGYKLLDDNSFYGCCACIGAAGVGMMPMASVLGSEEGPIFNFYHPGRVMLQTPGGKELTVECETEYPYDGRIKLRPILEGSETFGLTLRIPEWSRRTELTCNQEAIAVEESGYKTINRTWQSGDVVELIVDMRVKRILPPVGACNEEVFAAYRRGPIMLAADARLGRDPEKEVFAIECDTEGYAADSPAECKEIADAEVCVALPTEDGETVRLIDYASAGKTWSEASTCAVWMRK